MVKNLAYGGPGCSWTKNFAAQGTLNTGQPCASHEQPGEPGPRGRVGKGNLRIGDPEMCIGGCCMVPGEVWLLPRLLQAGEPGPRGGVGEGKSKYLRYLEDRFRDLHALRPGASADLQ